jgi:hypothetical protein
MKCQTIEKQYNLGCKFFANLETNCDVDAYYVHKYL